jgi:Protein of unknown function (DUF3768)
MPKPRVAPHSYRNQSPQPNPHRPNCPNRSLLNHKMIPKSLIRPRTPPNEENPMSWFRKHRTCPCGTDWWDEWECLCNDRCPACNAKIEPDEHEEIEGDNSAKIRTLNDRLRKSLTGGRVMMTGAVSALPPDVRARVIELTRAFDEFTPDNDPHQEHDFGSFEIDGQEFFSSTTTMTNPCGPAPKTQVTRTKRHACSPSCARTNTEAPSFSLGG